MKTSATSRGRNTTRGPSDLWVLRAQALVSDADATQRAMCALLEEQTRTLTRLRTALAECLGAPIDADEDALLAKLACVTYEAQARGIL